MNIFDDFKPLDWSCFDDSEKDDYSQDNNLEANLWHELGHVLAHCINTKLGYDLGNVVLVQLKDDKSFIQRDKRIYFYDYLEPTVIEGLDCYNQPNMVFYPDKLIEQNKILKDVNKNKRKAIAFMIFLISGGLFNIYAIEQKCDEAMLEDCYKNIEGGIDLENCYIGCAGNDWDKVRRIACILGWEYDKLILFRSEICSIFSVNNLFVNMGNYINESKPFNEVIEGVDLEKIIIELNKIADSKDLKLDIKRLIEKYN